jgi:hypothetical protein
VGAIAHFFHENVNGVDLARDMTNLERFVLDPFADRVFTKFNVLGGFRSHIVCPFDARSIVFV